MIPGSDFADRGSPNPRALPFGGQGDTVLKYSGGFTGIVQQNQKHKALALLHPDLNEFLSSCLPVTGFHGIFQQVSQ